MRRWQICRISLGTCCPLKALLAVLLIPLICGCPAFVESDTRLMVPMADGVRLDTRVIKPAGEGPWPVLLMRTPYPELSNPLFLKHVALGYAVVIQNTRGRYGSEGDGMAFASDGWGPAELGGHADGLDTVNWILEQPWCNGDIGTYGLSARGITSNLLASTAPPHVRAQWIGKAPANLYKGVGFYGGAFRQSLTLGWLLSNQYGDSSFRMFSEHPSYDEMWACFDMTTRQHLRNYPVVNQAGWYDIFLQGNIDNYVSIRQSGGPVAREHAKLIISLATHTLNVGETEWPAEAEGLPPGYSMENFFDHYLLGIANGYNTLPRVAYYMIGDLTDPSLPGCEWRYADDWPVRAADVPFYLRQDGALTVSPPQEREASISYLYDPENPVPTVGGANLFLPAGNLDQRHIESRPDVQIFEFGPLRQRLEVTGRVWVRLYASSDCRDTDFTAKLTDVYPNGRSVLICDGIVRGRYRKGESDPELLRPGTVYEFPIDLWSTAIVFNKNHTIRLAISSSNAPRFAPNPNTGAPLDIYDPVNPVVATNTVHFDAKRPSRLVLPVTGPDEDSDGKPDIVDPYPSDPRR